MAELKVVPLGEDGERYLVEGTTDPRAARTALELQLGADRGDPDGGEEAAADFAAVDARSDFWWQPPDDDGEEELLRTLHERQPPAGVATFSAVIFA